MKYLVCQGDAAYEATTQPNTPNIETRVSFTNGYAIAVEILSTSLHTVLYTATPTYCSRNPERSKLRISLLQQGYIYPLSPSLRQPMTNPLTNPDSANYPSAY
jgi:polygalacturonase